MIEIVNNEKLAIIASNAQKPIAYANFQFPYSKLDSRVFEILIYSLFKKRIETHQFDNVYDKVDLMQGVGEKGMDCRLYLKNNITGLIQCKRFASNISVELFLKELIKFCIHVIIDPSLVSNNNKFVYHIATTRGLSGNTITLINNLNLKKPNTIIDIENITNTVLKNNKSFTNILFKDINDQLLTLIKSFKYETILPQDIDLWISNFQEVEKQFFSIRTVSDNDVIIKRTNILSNKIDKLDTKITKKSSYNSDIIKFSTLYSKVMLEKLNTVNFIGFGLNRNRHRPSEINLVDLFVQPIFTLRNDSKNNQVNTNDFIQNKREYIIPNVFQSEKHIVLLGEPGSGKSLLVKYIMFHLLSKNASEIGMKEYTDFLPIRIELRKYNEYKDSKCIVDYLVESFKKEYQISITNKVLEYIFEKTNTIVFFDGFDEIFNFNHKNTVKSNIESFLTRFPMTKGVVTSRFIGYHDNQFSIDSYDEFSIIKLNDLKIKELVTKFFSTQYAKSERRDQVIINSLLQLKEVDLELKSNPLILTLVLILMYNNISIPDSKLEIYESCTKTLVDTIDEQKDLNIIISVENKRRTFAHLAYWQYESMSTNQVITNDKAIKSIADYLIEKGEVDDFTTAEDKATKFIEYALKRSIYFDNNFTHKTFLEYYTADYLYIKYFTKGTSEGRQKLDEIINKYLKNPFWYIVFELLLLKIDKDQEDNEVLNGMFSKLLKQDNFNVLYFFVSNLLKIQNISKEIRLEIISKAGLICIKGHGGKKLPDTILFDDDKSIVNSFYNLVKNSTHLPLVTKYFLTFEQSKDKYDEEILINFYAFIYELISYDDSLKEVIKISEQDLVNELSLKNVLLYSFNRLQNNIVNIEDIIQQIEYFGHNSIFTNIPHKFRPRYVRIATYFRYLINIVDAQEIKKYSIEYYKLKELGLSVEKIIEYVDSTNIYYFTNITKSFKNLIMMFVESEDENVDKVLFALISKQKSSKPVYISIRRGITKPKVKLLDKIFN